MYSIGQVLFVILSKKNQVYPMQVVEVITKKMLDGEVTSYVLQAGSDKTSKVTLDQVDGEVFETSEQARHLLVQRATSQINKIVDSAVNKSVEWYGVTLPETQPQTIRDLPGIIVKSETELKINSQEEDQRTVMMPDGSVVKVKLPSIMRDFAQ